MKKLFIFFEESEDLDAKTGEYVKSTRETLILNNVISMEFINSDLKVVCQMDGFIRIRYITDYIDYIDEYTAR